MPPCDRNYFRKVLENRKTSWTRKREEIDGYSVRRPLLVEIYSASAILDRTRTTRNWSTVENSHQTSTEQQQRTMIGNSNEYSLKKIPSKHHCELTSVIPLCKGHYNRVYDHFLSVTLPPVRRRVKRVTGDVNSANNSCTVRDRRLTSTEHYERVGTAFA